MIEPPRSTRVFRSVAALRRERGDRAVMREQMQRLLELGALPNVQLQVLPFANPTPVTFASLNFELMHLPGPGLTTSLDFVHIELYDDASYLDDEDRVAAYEQLWGHLQAAALGPSESVGFLGRVQEYG